MGKSRSFKSTQSRSTKSRPGKNCNGIGKSGGKEGMGLGCSENSLTLAFSDL